MPRIIETLDQKAKRELAEAEERLKIAEEVSMLHKHMDERKSSLSVERKQRLEAIEWLLSDYARAEGRSYLMATVYIEKALRTPDVWITVRDHFPTYNADRNLLSLIRNLLGQGTHIHKAFEFTAHSFRYVPPERKPIPVKPKLTLEGELFDLK